MELDSRKKSRRDRTMRSKSFVTQEVREIGRKEAGKSRGFPSCGWEQSKMSFRWKKGKRSPGEIEDVKKKIHARARKML